MMQENRLIVTAHPEFLDIALEELKHLDTPALDIVHQQYQRTHKGKKPHNIWHIEQLEPGIALCTTPDALAVARAVTKRHPIFARHIAPLQEIVELENTEHDISKLALAIAALPAFAQIEKGIRFAVQSRFIQTSSPMQAKADGEIQKHRPYTSGNLNRLLAEVIAEETGAIESIKKPQMIISILCTSHQGMLGISAVEENLSSWPGGARHFAQRPEQISRAEFKLLEALDVFAVSLPSEGQALDLGAAPGGWTRLLLEAGMHVTAIDPAKIDSHLRDHPFLRYESRYAESYIEDAVKKRKHFDVIVNDMRMDAREAARILGRASHCLNPSGYIISVFKLPHAADRINPFVNVREALHILSKFYGIVQTRQLFHNRQEITVVAAQPQY